MAKKFVPFNELSLYPNVLVVDCFHPDGLVLSHWRGAPKIEEVHDDTSTGIVLNSLEQKLPELEQYTYVTNNHFDVDGFLGVWSLCNPSVALEHQQLLRKMALIGDFRELRLETEEDRLALQLVCWINYVEKERFYAPFASYEPGKNEIRQCVSKYQFFLQQFEKALKNPEDYQHDWQQEYEQVLTGMEALQKPDSHINLLKDIRLLIVQTPEPLHYYALFSQSTGADMVLSLYSQQRYELEYKYTTWVDCTRKCFPRIDLQPLANQLNQKEDSPYLWYCDKITDTGPILRLTEEKLSKEQRFDHPLNRPLYSSSIAPDELIRIVQEYFRQAYKEVPLKSRWRWEEIRKINQHLKTKA